MLKLPKYARKLEETGFRIILYLHEVLANFFGKNYIQLSHYPTRSG
jgi:hypothetical protein